MNIRTKICFCVCVCVCTCVSVCVIVLVYFLAIMAWRVLGAFTIIVLVAVMVLIVIYWTHTVFLAQCYILFIEHLFSLSQQSCDEGAVNIFIWLKKQSGLCPKHVSSVFICTKHSSKCLLAITLILKNNILWDIIFIDAEIKVEKVKAPSQCHN